MLRRIHLKSQNLLHIEFDLETSGEKLKTLI